MKIGIDLTYIINDTNTGVGRYAEEILNGFKELKILELCYIFVHETFYEKAMERFSEAVVIKMKSSNKFKILRKICGKYIKGIESQYITAYLLPNRIKEYPIDVMLNLFAGFSTSMNFKMPVVSVVQDVYYKRFPQYLNSIIWKIFDYRYKNFIKKSVKIITTTQFVKEDIIRFYKIMNVEKIEVIPCPVEIQKNLISNVVVGGKYILCVNVQALHKNHITLLKAFSELKDKIPHKLVLVGPENNASAQIQKYIIENDLQSRTLIMKNLPEDKMANLYANASLFVTPSLNEGFGRTPIEAAMYEIPVISSRETSLPEVTKELLYYYEPASDSRKLADAMMEVITHPPRADELLNIALELKEEYNKNKVAQQIFNLCKNVVIETTNI